MRVESDEFGQIPLGKLLHFNTAGKAGGAVEGLLAGFQLFGVRGAAITPAADARTTMARAA